MNIVVRTYSRKTVTRPDTSWKRDDDASFLPEFVDAVTYAPVVFARISRAGRSIGEKFAGRYWDGFGYGVLLYAENLISASPEGFACASCLDHSSFLSWPVFERNAPACDFRLVKDGSELFVFSDEVGPLLEDAIVNASLSCYLRSGDFLAVELSPRKPLLDRQGGSCYVEILADGARISDFKLVL